MCCSILHLKFHLCTLALDLTSTLRQCGHRNFSEKFGLLQCWYTWSILYTYLRSLSDTQPLVGRPIWKSLRTSRWACMFRGEHGFSQSIAPDRERGWAPGQSSLPNKRMNMSLESPKFTNWCCFENDRKVIGGFVNIQISNSAHFPTSCWKICEYQSHPW